MKRKALLMMSAVALFLTLSAPSSAQPTDANDPLTLKDYLNSAALNNAGLKAAFEQWKMTLEQVPQAKSLPDPKFTYGYFIEEVETRVGPQRSKVEIMQMFPWFGEIEARTDAAGAAARAARQRYEAEKLKLFFEVKDAFYEYAYLAEAIEIGRQNLELVEHFEEVARTKYIAAAASHPDVIRAQVELAKLEDQLKTLEQLRTPIVARLNAVLNRQSLDMLPWPRAEKFQTPKVARQKVVELLRAQNPELRALDFELEAARSRVELAKKKFWPDVGVGVGWTDTDGAMNPGVRDSGKDPIILMFTMNLPIWRGSYRAAELQAKAELMKTAHQKTETENTIVARAERALYDFEDSNRKATLYGDVLVPKAEELLEASETAYRAGTIDFLSLINAQQKLLEFQLRYERAVADNQQGLARLEMLVGSEL
ncbi:MAG: TolC family protein [Phycisphaerales bacterium]|nr:MAG: TolC family protein [Phycisphaerales bacterium]